MTINALMAALVAELEADEVHEPLAQRFTLAAVWEDLARIAGEPLPATVVAQLATITAERVGEPQHLPLAIAYDAMRRPSGPEAWLPAD